MTAALLAPAGLAALAALALPLLIHLARRTEERTTPFAALRWLRPKPRPRRRPRLDERLLLAVRLLLLAVLALALAHPVLSGATRAQRWVAATPGVDPAAVAAAAGRGVRAVWLAPGFPDAHRPAPAGPAPLASLLREFDAGLPAGAALTVLAPAMIEGADAERPRLSRPVDWRTAPGAMPAPRPTPTTDPPLVLRAAPGREGEVRYLRAAATAWAAPPAPARLDAGALDRPTPPDARWIAWWSSTPLPAALRRRVVEGAVVLLPSDASVEGLGPATPVWRDEAGSPLAEGGALGRGRWRRLLRPLAPETTPELLDAGFPAQLHALFADPPPPPARVRAADYAPLTGARAGDPAADDLRPALALAAAALFALERGLATRRRRGAVP